MAVSVGAKPARAKATPVSRERFVMPAGYGGAWPDNEPTRRTTHSNQAPLVWRAPEGPEGTGGLRDRPLRAAGSRAAGPSGARNTSGAASNKLNREFRLHRRCEGRRRVQRAQEGLAAAPVGGGRAWPRCRWVAAGPGRASRSTTPSRRLACGDLAGGPPPTGTHSGPAPQAAQERCAA